VSVIPLAGLPGSDEANVNRWRGQVGLSPMSPDELKKSAESVEAGGQPAQLYDIAGQNQGSGDATRILGVIQHRAGAVWFFKMTGDADLAEQQKPAFVAFLKSVEFTTVQAQTELAHIVPEMDLPGDGHLTVVDFIGTDSKTGQPARLVGAVVPQSGQTWFYKLMGDAKVVESQKAAFIQFVQGVKY